MRIMIMLYYQYFLGLKIQYLLLKIVSNNDKQLIKYVKKKNIQTIYSLKKNQ